MGSKLKIIIGILGFLLIHTGSISAQTQENSWPMAGANPQRTSWTPEEVTGGLGPVWYRSIEPYIAPYVQLVAANGMVFAATSKGLYAFNADTGAQNWIFATDMPLGNSPTIFNGVAYIGGMDRRLYAISISNGSLLWSFDGAEAGYDTNPLVVNNTIYIGNRDGYMYAIDIMTHVLKWKFKTDGPITYSAALSADGSTLYFASNDSYAYALQTSTGSQVWKSFKFPGAGFRNWWPVVYQDKVIFVGTTPYRTVGPFGAGDRDMQNLDAAYMEQIGYSGCMESDVTPIADYLKTNPQRRTYFVLNANNGTEYTYNNGSYAPIAWFGTRAGSRYPAIVVNNTLYQSNNYCFALYSSRGQVSGWQVGTNTITTPAPHTNASDEPLAYSAGGNTIYWNLCCDREAGAFRIDGSGGTYYWSYNLDSRAPGYDRQYWGQAESGLNKLYAGKYNSSGTGYNGVYGLHGDTNAFVPYRQKLFVHRSNAIIAFGPGGSATSGLATASAPVSGSGAASTSVDLVKKLADEVDKILAAGHLRPGFGISGNADGTFPRNYDEPFMDYWANTSDTFIALARAYPLLDSARKTAVKTYLQNEYNTYNPMDYLHNGWAGAGRESYGLPPEVDQVKGGPSGYVSGRVYSQYAIYAMWQYATVVPEQVAVVYDAVRGMLETTTSYNQPYMENAAIAGAYGYRELARLAGDTTGVNTAQNRLNLLQTNRVNSFEKNNSVVSSDTANQYQHVLSVARNFMFMTPELGEYLAVNALTKMQDAINEYSYLAPYWFVNNFGATYAEGAIQPIYDQDALFNANAYILKRPYEDLVKYLDVPAVQRGDMYYIAHVATTLLKSSSSTTPPAASPTPTPVPAKPGDANGDLKIDGIDYMIWRNHYNQSVTGSSNGDFDNSGRVDGVDYMIWRNNYGK